jgi:hypothetical protein
MFTFNDLPWYICLQAVLSSLFINGEAVLANASINQYYKIKQTDKLELQVKLKIDFCRICMNNINLKYFKQLV